MDTEVRQQQEDQNPTICSHSHNDPEGNTKIKAKDSPIALEESVTSSDAEHATLLDANDISNIKNLSSDPVRHDNGNDKNINESDDDSREDATDDIVIEEEDSKANVQLQDQGWAWMVVLGSFWSHLITGGFERSDGVLFLHFTERFQESAQLTSWPAALCSTMRLVMGPIASAVCNRFSARTSVMLGTSIFAAGVIISGLAPNVLFLIFSYGLLQGIGRGLVYAPGLITVGLYLNRRRGLGVGLSTAGVGAGTFIFPPLVELLFTQFGFQGAFLILGGLALNIWITGALFRPLSLHRKIVLKTRKISPKDEEAIELITSNIRETAVISLNESTLPNHADNYNESFKQVTQTAKISNVTFTKTFSDEDNGNIMCKYTSPVSKQHRSGFIMSAIKTCFPVEERKKDAPRKRLIEWSLLKNPPFLFFCFSICLFTAAFKSAFTFLPSLASGKGITALESAYLLSISGILDTIGRVLAGVILDLSCIKPFRPIAYNGVVFMIMILSFLSPSITSFVAFAFLFGLYGMLTGAYVSQKSVILVDILGQEKLSSSLGLMICFQGLGTFIGPPVSGLLRDMYGRFDEAFYLGGTAMGVAACLMVISNIYLIIIRRRNNKAIVDTSNQLSSS